MSKGWWEDALWGQGCVAFCIPPALGKAMVPVSKVGFEPSLSATPRPGPRGQDPSHPCTSGILRTWLETPAPEVSQFVTLVSLECTGCTDACTVVLPARRIVVPTQAGPGPQSSDALLPVCVPFHPQDTRITQVVSYAPPQQARGHPLLGRLGKRTRVIAGEEDVRVGCCGSISQEVREQFAPVARCRVVVTPPPLYKLRPCPS